MIVDLDRHTQFTLFWAIELPVRIAAACVAYLFSIDGEVRLWVFVPVSLAVCTWYVVRHVQSPLKGWWGGSVWYHWARLVHIPIFFLVGVLAALTSSLTWWFLALDAAITAMWALWPTASLVLFRGRPLLFCLAPCFDFARSLILGDDDEDQDEDDQEGGGGAAADSKRKSASCAAMPFAAYVPVPAVQKLGLCLDANVCV